MSDVDERDANLVSLAYMALLRLPHRATRLRLQGVLATLRDEISSLTGVPSEQVQNMGEDVVARTR
jgi:hypothetical protein